MPLLNVLWSALVASSSINPDLEAHKGLLNQWGFLGKGVVFFQADATSFAF
jgi:hypothetical protein